MNPLALLIVFGVGGTSAVVGNVMFSLARREDLTLEDLLPFPPGKGPPLPRGLAKMK